MIRKRAQLDTVNPPGQIVNPITGQRTLNDYYRDKKYLENKGVTEMSRICMPGGDDDWNGWRPVPDVPPKKSALAKQPAPVLTQDRWVIVCETVLDIGNGDDVRTGGRPELGYALLMNAKTFDSLDAAREAHRAANLPLGWVIMPLSRLLPDVTLAAAIPPGHCVVPVEPTEEMLIAAVQTGEKHLFGDWTNAECKTDEERANKSNRDYWKAMIAARPELTKE